ncbi:MAG: hypothetical protein H0W02_13785 [Ktedonobacteraceae bacterium]|nr:hypothetical protein [Ktedonobacteraceae bacterium]
MSIHIFGVRHHGPGCARSLRAALHTLAPDIVLVEGPPDAQAVLPLLTHDQMRPPVALLIYAPDNPQSAVYYPFTHFSPEWQALRYALERGIPARFMDLPQAFQLGREPLNSEGDQVPSGTPPAGDENTPETVEQPGEEPASTEAPPTLPQDDPLAMLALAAGYSDHELWWERQIEQRRNITDLFEGILEAMTALRVDTIPKNEHEARREAHMRQAIRAAEQEGFTRIAVVCGAWHAPVLTNLDTPPARADAALLSGLKRVKVEATWIPWTNSRLSYRSGYGAGVTSPGWYEHLWTVPDRVTIRWLASAAHLLRKQGLDASSASVIEAVRLSETLASLRDLPMPGLAELHESIETVLCHGDAAPMHLIRDTLEIGERLGEVPPETPAVPLQRDLEIKQRRLRLKPSTAIEKLDFDLRNDTDRARSQLLHQLRLLGIEWGSPLRVSAGKRGTFHEYWQLQWHVEFVVSLIEANIWGNTVEVAASSFVRHQADEIRDLPALTELLDRTILAELPGAVDHLLHCVQERAAVSADVRHMMDALPPLARIARYGNVRQTNTEQVTSVINGLFERIIVGLPGACASLDDDAAQAMVGSIDNVQESVNTLHRDEQQSAWQSTMRQLIDNDSIHGLVRGRCCRLLLEQQVLDEEELQRLARLTLSPVTPAPQAAAWVEGVLRGSGLLLLHQDGLWRALNTWLSTLSPDDFVTLLPLLRRAFSGFQPPERRAMGEKVKRLDSTAAGTTRTTKAPGTIEVTMPTLNQERAHMVLPILARILEVQFNDN